MAHPIPQRSLKDDPRVIKSLNRLRSMGIKVSLEEMSEDWIMIVIIPESMINFVRNYIARNITYPNYYIDYSKEENLFVIHVWRGETPWLIKRKMTGLDRVKI